MFHSNYFRTSRRCGLFTSLLCLLLVLTPVPLHAAVGDLDPTFSGDGKVITRLGSGFDPITDIVIQTDGKMVVVGGFGMARLLATGALDPTFGEGGAVIPPNIEFQALVMQPDGKFVAAGGKFNFVLARYNTDGSLDHTFDGDGIVITDLGDGWGANALLLQSDDKLITAGGQD